VVRGFECSFLELDVIGDALGVDVRLFPFQFPVHGELVEERVELIKAAHGSLTAKGLIKGPRFDIDLEDLIDVFARGKLSVAMLGSADGDNICARAVSDGRSAVLATQHGQLVRFDPITPPSMVRSLLRLLPQHRPGPGRSVTFTVDEEQPPPRRPVEEDFGGRRYLQPVRPTRDSAGTQRAQIEEIMRRPRLGSGYFTVTAKGRHGRDGDPLTMNWLDTEAGRYVVIPSTGHDGRVHVTYTPADQSRLDQALSRLVNEMT
jgi:EspG family